MSYLININLVTIAVKDGKELMILLSRDTKEYPSIQLSTNIDQNLKTLVENTLQLSFNWLKPKLFHADNTASEMNIYYSTLIPLDTPVNIDYVWQPFDATIHKTGEHINKLL